MRTERAASSDSHHGAAHRSRLEVPAAVLEAHIAAHAAHVQPRRLPVALQAHARRSRSSARRPTPASSAFTSPLTALRRCTPSTPPTCDIGAHRRHVELAVLRDLHVQLRLAVAAGVRQHHLDRGAAVVAADIHALDAPRSSSACTLTSWRSQPLTSIEPATLEISTTPRGCAGTWRSKVLSLRRARRRARAEQQQRHDTLQAIRMFKSPCQRRWLRARRVRTRISSW